MTVSSRTPEGFPSKCSLCGTSTNLEFSEPTGDAPCPNCGHLVWLSAKLLSRIQNRFKNESGTSPVEITADTALAEMGADSLDAVELVMELEEEFDASFPDEIVGRSLTIGDVIRHIEQQLRREK